MSNEKAAVERQHDQPQTNGAIANNTGSILTAVPADVKALRDLRSERRIPVADIVEVVNTLYPKFDRYLLSKAEHGEEYGIRLRTDAERLLFRHFADQQQKARKPDKRTKPRRIQARVSEEVYGTLQRLTAQSGQTMQEFLEGLILKYISEDKSHE